MVIKEVDFFDYHRRKQSMMWGGDDGWPRLEKTNGVEEKGSGINS